MRPINFDNRLNPYIDIVILNHNGRKFLDDCLRSVLNSTYENKKVYLLDNASTEDDVAYVRQNYPQVNIIQNPNNNGYCAAYNLAFRHCDSPYIICLNNDLEVHPGWLEPLISKAEQQPDLGALQPKLLNYFDHSKFEYAGAAGGKMDKYGYPFLRGRVFHVLEEDNGQYNHDEELFWASGAALMLRRSALKEVGEFDELIVHHFDEIDLCWRLILGNYRIGYAADAEVYHIGGASISPNSYKKVYWNHRNSLYMLLKNYEFQSILSRVSVHVLLDWILMIRFLLGGQFKLVVALMHAHTWLLINSLKIRVQRKRVQKIRKRTDKETDPFLYQGSIVKQFFLHKKDTYTALIEAL